MSENRFDFVEFDTTPIECDDLPARVYHALKSHRIDTYEQLAKQTRENLLTFRRIGPHSLSSIQEALAQHGFSYIP